MPRWIKVLDPDGPQPLPGRPFLVLPAGRELLLMKTSGGEWKAWEPVCPHERAGLKGICPDADGYIVCPLHRYRFSLSDGYESQGRGRLYLYPVEERESGLYISI